MSHNEMASIKKNSQSLLNKINQQYTKTTKYCLSVT